MLSRDALWTQENSCMSFKWIFIQGDSTNTLRTTTERNNETLFLIKKNQQNDGKMETVDRYS